ncbi:MAG: TlpA family protein disulfide reductase [Saprospiraceae bacterium]|nr:TlpA family protein disulfide reductase [Saprospiraceae bacterium]
MKNYLFPFFLFLLAAASAQQAPTILSGNLGKSFLGTPVYLSVFDFEKNEYQPVQLCGYTDSIGKFYFTFEFQPYSLFKISVGGEKYQVMGIQEPEHIHVAMEQGKWTVSGSETTDEIKSFRKKIKLLNEKYFQELTRQGELALQQNDQAQLAILETQKDKNMELFYQEIETLIQQIKQPVAIFDALSFLDNNKNLDILKSSSRVLDDLLPGSALSKNVANRVKATQQVAIGALAPEWREKILDTVAPQLSDFRGKYLLVDFWASWCLPCRIAHPVYREIYQDTERQTFEILSISLDEDQSKWASAIEKDQMRWKHIRDAGKAVAALYGIQSLPQNVLIDKNGHIISKNLPPEKLRSVLKDLLR